MDLKFYVPPAPKLPPGEGEPSEEAGAPLPGQESAEEDGEEEESGTQKDSQKVLEKSQGAQQLEGKTSLGLKLFMADRSGEWGA